MLPIDDTLVQRLAYVIGPAYPIGGHRRFRPGGSPVSDESIPALWGGFRLTAEVTVGEDAVEGVVCALGDAHGGFALFVEGGQAVFVFSTAGRPTAVAAPWPPASGRRALGVSYQLHGDGTGRFLLLDGDSVLASTPLGGMLPVQTQHGGAGLRLGYDSGFAVSARYAPPSVFTGQIHWVEFDTPGVPPPDAEAQLRTALHAD